MKARSPSKLENILDTDPGKKIILCALDERDCSHLMLVNYSMSRFFKTSDIWLDKLKHNLAQVPDETKAKFVLKRNPSLLNFEFKQVVFPLYTVMNVTPLQLVHGARDIEMRDNVLKPLFIEHYGNEEKAINEMQKQISEMKNVHKKFDFNPIIQAISNELFNLGQDAEGRYILSNAMHAAIDKFNKEYDENQPKIIDKGMQFRWETLEEFKGAYDVAATQWNNHFFLKCALLKDVVLSRILRYATENDKQRFNQGLSHFQKYVPEPFKRMQTTRDGHNFDEVLKKPSVDFVLDSSCVNIIEGRGATQGWRFDTPFFSHAAGFAEFLSNKNVGLAEPMQLISIKSF